MPREEKYYFALSTKYYMKKREKGEKNNLSNFTQRFRGKLLQIPEVPPSSHGIFHNVGACCSNFGFESGSTSLFCVESVTANILLYLLITLLALSRSLIPEPYTLFANVFKMSLIAELL